jgi:hypothetical protein
MFYKLVKIQNLENTKLGKYKTGKNHKWKYKKNIQNNQISSNTKLSNYKIGQLKKRVSGQPFAISQFFV